MLLEKTNKTKIQRNPNRANYDRDVIYQIIDEAYLCYVGVEDELGVRVIPMAHWREDNHLYLHGATKSRLMKTLEAKPACINITLLDGLVMARSAFHHSMNYRSVNIYAKGIPIEGEKKEKVLANFVEKITPDRASEVRAANKQELKATTVLAFPIEEAVAKIRTGPPVDDKEDYALPVWAGVIPLKLERGPAIRDENKGDFTPK